MKYFTFSTYLRACSIKKAEFLLFSFFFSHKSHIKYLFVVLFLFICCCCYCLFTRLRFYNVSRALKMFYLFMLLWNLHRLLGNNQDIHGQPKWRRLLINITCIQVRFRLIWQNTGRSFTAVLFYSSWNFFKKNKI